MEKPLRRKDQLIAEELSGECVIYDSRQKKAHHLNPTLTWIWHRCDGSTSIDAIAAAFEKHFDTGNGIEIVLSGLDQLQSCQLLETPISISSPTADEKLEPPCSCHGGISSYACSHFNPRTHSCGGSISR